VLSPGAEVVVYHRGSFSVSPAADKISVSPVYAPSSPMSGHRPPRHNPFLSRSRRLPLPTFAGAMPAGARCDSGPCSTGT
jgi:hypothetical protein